MSVRAWFDRHDYAAPILWSVLTLIITAMLTVAGAAAEARAYERVTGEHVSTWDALFLDLRVQAEPRKP